jgi:hypothetical protein
MASIPPTLSRQTTRQPLAVVRHENEALSCGVVDSDVEAAVALEDRV